MFRITEALLHIARAGGEVADKDLPDRLSFAAELASYMGLVWVDRVDIVADGTLKLTDRGWKWVGGRDRP